MATASNDCAAVSQSSCSCLRSRCSALGLPILTEYTMGNVPTSRVHWLTFEETSAPSPAGASPRNVQMRATMNSGASEASGASHWTSRNSLIPQPFPAATSDSANGSADMKMTQAEYRNSALAASLLEAVGRSPSHLA